MTSPKQTWAEWIEEYVSQQPNRFVRGKCDKATELMVEAFPELKRVAGFVHCSWGLDQHWWCVSPEGAVVDPTASQFQSIYQYEELDPEDPATRARVPTGICLDCGEAVYNGDTFCNERCELATRRYMGL